MSEFEVSDVLSAPQVVHAHRFDPSPGQHSEWPDWLPAAVVESVEAAGITRPWAHQRALADLAHDGHHCAITTATASGKTLAYLLPVMAATAVPAAQASAGQRAPQDAARERLGLVRHSALYLAPTKALAHDQLRAAKDLGPDGWWISTLDGDSSQAERRFARDQASYILTNPDMLHRAVLPNHAKWSGLLGSLRYIVVDEAHRYRGVFGAHVAAVIRRLRRLCALYGSDPTVILASATSTNAGESGAALIGEDEPLAVVSENTASRGGRTMVLWQPADSTNRDTAELMAELVDDGAQVLAFVPSRNQAELVALRAQELVKSGRPVASYRSGYLADDRRSIESGLSSGELAGVAATNALELGVDITGLDAVVIAGYPGTLAALWQQAGRAGRAGQEALIALLAREDPLDAYLFAHPELIFDAPLEATVLNPANPHVLAPQLAAAAQESPLTMADERWFGPTMAGLADGLVGAGLLRRRPAGWFWTHPSRAVDAIDLRGLEGKPLDVVDEANGRVVGMVDRHAADRTVHEGAVYLHQGEQWLVTDYRPEDGAALVRSAQLRYYTQPKSLSDLRICSTEQSRAFGPGTVSHGEVEMAGQVIGYLRRDEQTGEVWDETPLELPVRTYRTHAVWWTIPDAVASGLGLNAVRTAAGAHGAEHTAIGLLPMFTPCDRWDIGGLSTLLHPDTGVCTIFVHDGAPGGAGFAERGYELADRWIEATWERLRSCSCDVGCPACVVSPKCGNANQMLDKAAATALLGALLERE